MTRVYFIQGVDGGPIKIGISRSPEARLRSLQAASPVALDLLTTMPGSREIESLIHQTFSVGRLHGEWFSEDTPELDVFIEDLIAPDLGRPAVAELYRCFRAALDTEKTEPTASLAKATVGSIHHGG